MSYSSWITYSSPMGYAVIATLCWITFIISFTKLTWTVFLLFPWWFFFFASVYLTTLAFGMQFKIDFSFSGYSGAERVPGTIAKTYAPFMIFVYWAAVYPTHNPWHDPTKTYLVLMAHILLPAFIMFETFRPKNTHYSDHPQINGDFLGAKSFSINTAIYVIFFIVYLITVPHIKDPIYTHLGFTKNASEDAILAFVGWCIVMSIDSVIAGITYWIKNKESERQREQFSRYSSDPTPYARIFISGNTGL